MVTTSAEQPHSRARAIAPSATSRPPNQVELVPDQPRGRRLDVLHGAPGERRQDIRGASLPGHPRRDLFAAGPEHAAAADRGEKEGEVEPGVEHGRREVAARGRHGRPRSEHHVVKCPAVLAERQFGVGSAVDVVEDHSGQSSPGRAAQVGDVQDMGWVHAGRHLTSGIIPPSPSTPPLEVSCARARGARGTPRGGPATPPRAYNGRIGENSIRGPGRDSSSACTATRSGGHGSSESSYYLRRSKFGAHGRACNAAPEVIR